MEGHTAERRVESRSATVARSPADGLPCHRRSRWRQRQRQCHRGPKGGLDRNLRNSQRHALEISRTATPAVTVKLRGNCQGAKLDITNPPSEVQHADKMP